MLDQPTVATSPDAHDFLRRVLRWLAIVCVALGGVRLSSFLVYPFRYRGVWPAWYYSSGFRRLELLAHYATAGTATLLIVGGIALLRWRSWSRAVLLTWAALVAMVSLTSNGAWFVQYSTEIRASTQPAMQPSIAWIGW